MRLPPYSNVSQPLFYLLKRFCEGKGTANDKSSRAINGLDDMLGSTICIHQLFRQTSFLQTLLPGRRKNGYPKAHDCVRLGDENIQSYGLRDFHSGLYSHSRSNVAFFSLLFNLVANSEELRFSLCVITTFDSNLLNYYYHQHIPNISYSAKSGLLEYSYVMLSSAGN